MATWNDVSAYFDQRGLCCGTCPYYKTTTNEPETFSDCLLLEAKAGDDPSDCPGMDD